MGQMKFVNVAADAPSRDHRQRLPRMEHTYAKVSQPEPKKKVGEKTRFSGTLLWYVFSLHFILAMLPPLSF